MRRAYLLAAGFGALALAGLVLLRRAPAPPPPPASAPATAAPRPASPPAPPGAAPPATPVADVVALAASPDETELPPPTPEQILPRPERSEPVPAEVHAQTLASLDLIARSIERLEQERQDAARSGDDDTARRNKIRIERLRVRHEALEQAAALDAPE